MVSIYDGGSSDKFWNMSGNFIHSLVHDRIVKSVVNKNKQCRGVEVSHPLINVMPS